MPSTAAMRAATTVKTTATVEAAPAGVKAMGTASETRLTARREASGVSSVIKATQRAGVCSGLRVRRCSAVKSWISAPVKPVFVVEIGVAAVEVVVIHDRAAVGDISAVIEHRVMAVPVVSPVIPAPAKPAEEADSKSSTEVESWAAKKDSGHRIPTWVRHNRIPIHEPRIVGWHVNNVRVCRLNDDRVSLSRYVLLFIAIQLSGLLS